MDYEKKYKDAMARLELVTRTGLKLDPTYIFPELAESEGERIRTLLISSVKNETPIASEHNKELAIAWLEKQGEQPFDYENANIHQNDFAPIEPKFDPDDLIEESYQQQADDLFDVVTGKPSRSEDDEHRIKDTIYFLETSKKHYASTVELDACIDWLKTLKQRIGG